MLTACFSRVGVLYRYVIMVSNARRKKLKKRGSIMAGCSTFVRKVKRSRVVTSNGEIRREMKILLIQFAR